MSTQIILLKDRTDLRESSRRLWRPLAFELGESLHVGCGVKAGKPHCEHILSALLPLATEERTFGIGSSVPIADQVHGSKQRAYWTAFPTSTIRGTRMINVEPRPGSLSTVMSPPII